MSIKKHSFQAEVSQVLHLVTHSLYSNPEIFLRELVSNAADACDKLRFEALNNASLYEGEADLRVRISFDEQAKTLTIEDNGIGMSESEAIDNLGTIAKSGTREFTSRLTGDAKADSQLIGQFGVGFYSAFIVADSVTVETRRAGAAASEGVRWTSRGTGDFEVEPIERAARGTRITLHLRDEASEFLNGWKLKSVINKYSDHISLPVQMEKEEWQEAEQEGQPGSMVKTGEWETIRAKISTPSSSSNSIMALETPGCEVCNALAASVKLRLRRTASCTKRNWWRFIYSNQSKKMLVYYLLFGIKGQL